MYEIVRDYIRLGGARSGLRASPIKFIVAHDTGNPGSTARNNRTYFDREQPDASAHTFIDDTEILEILPLNEKAWHVMYQMPADNELFGGDANDFAIGVELCFGGNIDFAKAYSRYVWYLAYLCVLFGLAPDKKIVGHSKLDPKNKIDPENGLRTGGKTFADLIQDVGKEYERMHSPILSVEDANKIIRFLGAAWFCCTTEQDKTEMSRLANELRKASGQKSG